MAGSARRRHQYAAVEALAGGEEPPPPLPDYEGLIDEWHNGAGEGQELHEYLGMTWEEYKAWVEKA